MVGNMGVPVYRLEIRKQRLDHDWANDYLLEAASMELAQSMATTLLAFEQGFHSTVVNFVYYRISTVAKFDRIFRHVAVNLPGHQAAGTADFLPLFNTVRFDLMTGDADPCRKYYRVPLNEGIVTNEVIDSGFLDALNSNFAIALAAFPEGTRIVSTKGNIVLSGRGFPIVTMRQLHRHKRKKVA
jgi:hypothetical protein